MAYLKELLKDPLFMRVCMFLWGVPFTVLGVYVVASWRPVETYEWIGIALLCAIALFGLYLVTVSVFGSNARVEKSTDFLHEGGELVGLVLAIVVAVIAIPITMGLRVLIRGTRA